ncbi:MAG: hypothetical protein H7Y07_13540 [Pyrinomonadaceae bacterium]|nr:hypothetical protein [Sphingobacteriaceae bacterium]
MKKFICLLSLFILVAACKKDRSQQITRRLVKITDVQSTKLFTYDSNNRLVKEQDNRSWPCFRPLQETFYTYQDSKLIKAKNISILEDSEGCDPSQKFEFEQLFLYHENGNIKTISQLSSSLMTTATSTEYFYDQRGLIIKTVLKWDNQTVTTNFKHDSRGNVIKMIDANGFVTHYEFDNKKNPYYFNKIQIGLPTPFTMSPNNIIKGTGSQTYTRQFKYDSSGWPVEVLETNGRTYIYHYENN